MSNIEKKKLVVKETLTKFRESTGIIITDYQGLTVEQISKLRRLLEKAGAQYKVIKNTLSKRAIDELNINGNMKSLFSGVTGLVFCKDYIAAVKVLTKFAADNTAFKIKGGYIESKAYSVSEIKDISKLSSKEELIAKLVMLLNQPVTRMVNSLSSPKRNIVYILKAVADKKAKG